MFAIDMVGLSEADLEKIVAGRCSRYGRIANVRVVRLASGYTFALVRMAAPDTLDALITDLGGSKSRSTAIIPLAQETALH